MGRKNRRNDAKKEVDDAPIRIGGHRKIESGPDGDWVVQSVTGSATTTPKRCPGCDLEIRPATPHIVAWPYYEMGEDREVEARRHWHTPCWKNRAHRRPTRR
jgi:hypothetical protein